MGKTNRETKAKAKWDFAIGTTSRVPGTKGFHYLILDIDTKGKQLEVACNKLDALGCDYVTQETRNGFHIYTNFITSFFEVLFLAKIIGADETWLKIGQRREYLYLADKDQINLAWPVERMIIHHGQKR